MTWDLRTDRPIYLQLSEQITQRIIAGQYPPGERLPSVRDLAQDAGVNPNTMQRALAELERTGMVFSQRTSGRFITEDTEMLDEVRDKLAIKQIEEFLSKMEQLGFDAARTIQLIETISKH